MTRRNRKRTPREYARRAARRGSYLSTLRALRYLGFSIREAAALCEERFSWEARPWT